MNQSRTGHEVVGPPVPLAGSAGRGNEAPGSAAPKAIGKMEKVMWWLLVFLSAFWVFLPEPTDAVPVLGWLDEALAIYLLATALDRLGIHIPILHKYLSNRTGVGKAGKADRGRKGEKDVTPPRG